MRYFLNSLCLLLIPIVLSGCTAQQTVQSSPKSWLNSYGIAPPNIKKPIQLCIDFGCKTKGTAQFSHADILQITALFQPISTTPADERLNISLAIGLMEEITGIELNTRYDQPENNAPLFSKGNQLDCIAESGNSATYLLLLEQLNLLKHHSVTGITHRGLFTLNAPHNSASIQEKLSTEVFAVDSWFGANGNPAWITPLSVWEKGARPKNK